jgi:lipopolysaccharide export system protein LptA
LSDGPNVTRGERVVYDINTGVANVETKPGGRVRALFVPGSGGPAPTGAGANAKPASGKATTN